MTEQELRSLAGSYIAGNALSHTIANNLGRIVEEQQQQLEADRARFEEYKKCCPSSEVIASVVTEYFLKEERDAANKYLDETLANNLIYIAKNTKGVPFPLDDYVEETKGKYRPFYEQIGREMPKTLSELSADKLCEMLGISKYVPIPQEEWDAKMAKLKKEVEKSNSGCLSSIILFVATISVLTIAGCCLIQ